eukprot:1519574-Lingulodinium_polyedra.AAC.1
MSLGGRPWGLCRDRVEHRLGVDHGVDWERHVPILLLLQQLPGSARPLHHFAQRGRQQHGLTHRVQQRVQLCRKRGSHHVLLLAR